MSYAVTKNRIVQWTGIILILCLFGGAYWYFKVYGSTLNAPQNDLSTNGLVGLWSFNGDDISGTTAYDRSGSGNNGTLTGGPTATQGKVGQALDFDGTNDYVSTADYSYSNAQAFTMSVWFKADTVSGNQVIFSKETYEYNLRLTGSALAFSYWDTGGLDEIGLFYSNVVANRWYLISVTYNGSGAAYMYVNGVQVASDTSVVDTFQNKAEALRIGGGYHVSGNPGYLNGQIDEMRVYNRALSAEEIQSLYAQGGGTKIDSAVSQPQGIGRLDSGLAGYWALDDGSGTSATDSSTNGNNAGFINTPTWTTGQIGGALDFTDPLENQSLSVGDVLDMPDGANFSIAGWFYRSTFNTIDIIFAKTAGLGAGYTGYGIYINDTSDALVFLGADGTDMYTLTSSSTFTSTGWNHFVAVWNDANANETKLYINGKLESATASGTFANVGSMSNVDPIHIGSESDIFTSNDRSFRGRLDEVRVYNRTLSADEVSQLYRLSTPTSVDTGLKGYWSFNGKDMSSTSAYDRSGAGNNGTLTNGPTVTPGKVGQALSFDGSDDYVTVADSTALSPTSAMTVSFWANVTNISLQCRTFLAKNTSGGRSWFITTTTSGAVAFYVASNTNDSSTNGTTGGGLVSQNSWVHIVSVFDGSGSDNAGRAKVYVNGVQQLMTFSGTVAATLTDTSQAIRFGESAGGCTALPGSLDEVRIYNTALSAAQIQSLYKQGQADEVNTGASQAQGTGRLDSGLAGYWKLDDGSGTSATDSSTNGNTGTLTNGPTWGTGQIGGDVDFDGTNDYVTMGDQSIHEGMATMTLSGWIKMDALPVSNYMPVSKSQGFGQYRLNIDSTGIPSFVVATTNNTWYSSGTVASGSTALTTSTWVHLLGTYDGQYVRIYVNGVLTGTGSQAISGAIVSDIAEFRLGYDTYGNYFNGQIDEVRLYNRALSAEEVAQLYRVTAPTGVDTSLKGYWSFNGKDISGTTAYDRSGAGNNGTLTNGPSITEGKIGQGLSFDGVDDYVDTTSTTAFNSATITVSAWVRPDVGNTLDTVVSRDNSGSLRNWNLGNGASANTFRFAVFISNTQYNAESAAGFSTGVWHHLVGTYDGTNVRLYVDGVNTATTAQAGSLDTDAIQVTIGRRGNVDEPWDGLIDEVRIYNTALTAAQIAALYNSSR